MFKFPQGKLKSWFLDTARDFPWRDTPSPYSVWISEVMLQQTQAVVVIPYFQNWMKRFPDIPALATAPLDEVIKLWEGLGYYSRARSLHEGAKYILEKHQGIIPNDEESLKKIKGLGPYTVGAILSFAFHKKAVAVDGNVIRVLTRFYGIKEDVSKAKTVDHLRKIALEILPNEDSWIQNEALIELGATVCSKKSKCQSCPIRSDCVSYAKGDVTSLPYKSAKTKTEYLYRSVPVIYCDQHFLIKRGTKGKVMSDLHEFPYFETGESGWNQEMVHAKIKAELVLKVDYLDEMEVVKHSFTKYQVRLNPLLFKTKMKKEIEGYMWMTLEELNQLAFSSGHKRILNMIQNTTSLK